MTRSAGLSRKSDGVFFAADDRMQGGQKAGYQRRARVILAPNDRAHGQLSLCQVAKETDHALVSNKETSH